MPGAPAEWTGKPGVRGGRWEVSPSGPLMPIAVLSSVPDPELERAVRRGVRHMRGTAPPATRGATPRRAGKAKDIRFVVTARAYLLTADSGRAHHCAAADAENAGRHLPPTGQPRTVDDRFQK
jgi:hypothetical protein